MLNLSIKIFENIFMIFINLYFLFENVHSIDGKLINVIPNNLESNILSGSSNQESDFVKVNSNVSNTCLIKFDCNRNNCQMLTDIQWLLPRQLREHEMIFGPNSNRAHFTHQEEHHPNGAAPYVILKSQMNITNAGAIHNGVYICTHDLSNFQVSFNISIKGKTKQAYCVFDDQCLSWNCVHEQCQCDLNQTYVDSEGQCYQAVDWNNSCVYNEQCSYKLGKGYSICSDGLCKCNQNNTVVSVPLIGKKCFKKSGLNDSCQLSGQCRSTDPNSFCSTNDRCNCNNGYGIFGNKCKPYQTCNISNNSNSCGTNQICKDYICDCQPSYLFDENGNCYSINSISKDKNSEFLEQYGPYIVGLLGILLVVALFMIIFQIRRYKQVKSLTVRTGSTDPLNRN